MFRSRVDFLNNYTIILLLLYDRAFYLYYTKMAKMFMVQLLGSYYAFKEVNITYDGLCELV